MFIWLSRFELYTNRDNPINLYNAHSANKLINFSFSLAKTEYTSYKNSELKYNIQNKNLSLPLFSRFYIRKYQQFKKLRFVKISHFYNMT